MQIETIYNQSLQYTHKVKEYCLNQRNLTQCYDLGYLPQITHNNQTLYNVIVMPIQSALNDLVGLELREIDNKRYIKIYKSNNTRAIYNICLALKNIEYVFVCEGVFDCLSIRDCGYNAIALLSANAKAQVKHSLAVFKNLIFTLDNDSVGNKASNAYVRFYDAHYSEVTNTHILRLPYKDASEYCIKNKQTLKADLANTLSEVVNYGL